jgi:hypothetical protein
VSGRPSRPEEQPPRKRGGRLAWLTGTIPGMIALGFLVVCLIAAIAALAL